MKLPLTPLSCVQLYPPIGLDVGLCRGDIPFQRSRDSHGLASVNVLHFCTQALEKAWH